MNEARNRHHQLAGELRRHDHAYYVLAQPFISDQDLLPSVQTVLSRYRRWSL